MAERIGKARCPLCAGQAAHLSVSKKQLACIACPPPALGGCGSQTFARSDVSDGLLRKLHLVGEPTPTPAPGPVADPKPAPAPAGGPPGKRRGLLDIWGD